MLHARLPSGTVGEDCGQVTGISADSGGLGNKRKRKDGAPAKGPPTYQMARRRKPVVSHVDESLLEDKAGPSGTGKGRGKQKSDGDYELEEELEDEQSDGDVTMSGSSEETSSVRRSSNRKCRRSAGLSVSLWGSEDVGPVRRPAFTVQPLIRRFLARPSDGENGASTWKGGKQEAQQTAPNRLIHGRRGRRRPGV